MAVTILTGYKAAVNGVDCARKWGITSIAEDVSAICSASRGTAVRGPGNKDWEGFWDAYGICPALTHKPGAIITFTGATETGGGATGTCIVKRWIIDYPVETGGFVSNRVDFECNGTALAFTGSASDASIPDPVSAAKLGCSIATNVRRMQIVIECKNAESIDSTSDGIRTRVKGNLDASAIILCNVTGFGSLPSINTVAPVTIGSGGSAATWVFTSMKVMRIVPIVDIEGKNGRPEVVAAEIHLEFSGYNNGVVGSIVTPLGSIWPPA